MQIWLLIARRSLLSAATLLLVSGFVFFVLEVLPGDVATRILGRDATPESLQLLREQLGLEQLGLEQLEQRQLEQRQF